jgi:hypothetical protein
VSHINGFIMIYLTLRDERTWIDGFVDSSHQQIQASESHGELKSLSKMTSSLIGISVRGRSLLTLFSSRFFGLHSSSHPTYRNTNAQNRSFDGDKFFPWT